MTIQRVTSPDDAALADLCRLLVELAPTLDEPGAWPGEQLRLCGEAGVYEWFLPGEVGGQGWSESDVVRGYLQLAAACLTTTFIITQRSGACSRIAASENEWVKRELLPGLLKGDSFATVGISHLTTSRQHVGKPVMRVEETIDGYLLDGFTPWVTGAAYADHVVLGGTMDDGRQILVALPTDLLGIRRPAAPALVGLTASHTGALHCDRASVDRRWLLAGPVPEVMKQGLGAKTGGLQTSTLAAGLASAAITYLAGETVGRAALSSPAAALREEQQALERDLLQMADGVLICSNEELRTRANSLALRSAQAALVAAKGAGYVVGHPAGRWCREALFFLVWSCPQPVLAANLCELAGLEA